MGKDVNKAIIGNESIVASFSKQGELQRFCYPNIDGRQFVDYFHVGVKINDSNIIYLHDDINNGYSQNYIDKTNILETNIKNKYFNLEVKQTDCIFIKDNILLKKYIFENKNSIDLDIKLVINSKVLAGSLENFGSKIFENGVIQYNHNYTFCIFSNNSLYGHKLNDAQSIIQSAVLTDKDYIGMSNEVAISYDVGIIKSGEQKEFSFFVYATEHCANIEQKLNNYLKKDYEKELQETKRFWNNYLEKHTAIKLNKNSDEYTKKISEIYERTILLYPLLLNYKTGGIAAALEVDDERARSGGYRYCWPRDAIFITKAFNLLKMESESEHFYNEFCKQTQSDNGMWEQRFFSDGTLAPCWGYQVDETASVIYGVYEQYKFSNNKEFLEKNLKMCEKATKFLISYVENLLEIEDPDVVKKELDERYKKYFEVHKRVSYDLWEMNEGVHLYSISSIVAAFKRMNEIYNVLNDENEKNARLKLEKRNKLSLKLNKYIDMLQNYIEENFKDKNTKTLKRNLNDNQMDISIMGAIYPFEIFDTKDEFVKNTVDKINMTLRTYTNGYLRFENDSYMGGGNPWVITTLWMALYYIKIGKIKAAEQCFKYVVNTASEYGFLSEQVNNENSDFQWVIGLGWSHAMFIIVLDELLKKYDK